MLSVLSVGCASPPEIYNLPAAHYVDRQHDFEDAGPQVEKGRANPLLDGLNHYVVSLPTKALLLNWRVLDHKLDDEGRRLLERYLELNQMRAVKVRHNQWAPLSEFRRLRSNSDVAAGYRYTLGVLTWLQYTLLPGRLLAGVPIVGLGDHFNPFTNTIHVYSSDPTVLLHEAGHAKDYLEKDNKGTTALMRLLPGVDLIQEARASQDAIRFLFCIHDVPNEFRSYRTLIPAYSTYIAGYVPGGLQAFLPVVAGGHVSGRLQAWRRQREVFSDEGSADALRRQFLPDWCNPLQLGKEAAQ